MFFAGSARYLLPMAAPLALLASRLRPRWLAAGFGLQLALGLGLVVFLVKIFVLAGAVVLVETVNAKMRLFRVPDLLSAAFVLATMALLSTFLFH